MTSSVKACVIGLGSMGLGMAQSLVRKGLDVTGADLNPAAVKKLDEAGGRGFSSAADAAADVDILVTVVVNAAQTEVDSSTWRTSPGRSARTSPAR